MINLLKRRGVSTSDLAIVFSSCALFVYIWAILDMLYSLDRWVLHLSFWDLVGVIAYTQAFALIESLVVFLFPLGAVILIPKRWKGEQFVALASALVWTVSYWAMAGHLRIYQLFSWDWRKYLVWLLLFAVSLGLISLWILRFPRLETLFYKVALRFSVLSYFYISFGILGLLIVIIRNL